jgi:hypothetical protein
MMAIKQLDNNLGNQLFQLFSLLGISKKNNYNYLIDKNNDKKYWNNILNKLPNCEDKYVEFSKQQNGEIIIVNECRFSQFNDIELDKEKMLNVMLNGKFQSFFYFENIKDDVFNLIKNQNIEILNKVNDIYNNLKSKYDKQLIFIHRTNNSNDIKIFKKLSIEYYKKALSHFNQDECVFIIFCDESSSIEEFDFLKYKEFIVEDDYIELLLMSKMDGAILSNLSISFWGAYLMDYYKCKKIICPKYLFAEWDIHRYDCFQKHWLFIENKEMIENVYVDPQYK